MSGVLENRAAVFTREPQEVEVYRDGAWWPGSLLGWRHDTHGSCQVWVRLAVGGAESTTWTDLETLRLPSTRPGVPAVPVAADPGCRSTGDTPADTASTRQLRPFDAGVPGSRRGGRPAVPAPVSSAAVAEGLAPEPVRSRRLGSASGERPPTPGRHRAPAVTGRHRAADTETFPAVADDVLAPLESWTVEMSGRWPVVVEDPWAGSGGGTQRGAAEPDAGPFTRPLRLKPLGAGSLPQPRAALRDGRRAPA